LIHADFRDVLLEPGSVSAVVCDPPYELGFMGKKWDSTGIAFQPKMWEAVLRVCKPGTPLLAFGGTRTYHRLVCAIEDAGWEIRDCLMWLYGSGFPKSRDISKAIDKAAGAERPVHRGVRSGVVGGTFAQDAWSKANKDSVVDGTPITDAAKEWDGWGTALSPSWEPIVLAMKPLDGTFAANALEHGVAGINVDGCRIFAGTEHMRGLVKGMTKGGMTAGDTRTGKALGRFEPGRAFQATDSPLGRWPKNCILSHHESCVQRGVKRVKASAAGAPQQLKTSKGCKGGAWANAEARHPEGHPLKEGLTKPGYADADGLETVEDWDCHPDCPVGMLGEQSGERQSSARPNSRGNFYDEQRTVFASQEPRPHNSMHGDSGSAARFFYCAKADKAERGKGNTHPTVKPLDLMTYLCRLVSMPGHAGTLLDPFCGSGSTLLAATRWFERVIGIDSDEEACAIAANRLRQEVLF